MAVRIYRIDEFMGIDQSADENAMNAGMSPDACNMNTEDGGLRVAKGYVRETDAPIPGNGEIYALAIYARPSGDMFIAAANESIYAFDGSAWQTLYTYENGLQNHAFDFEQARIGTSDCMIIGCGERQLVKYDGTSASLFGSADDVSDIHVLYLATYRSRLFSAGDPDNPNRLYWSQLPGSGRTIEAWGPVSASANVEGGHAEVGSMGSDPIIGLAALSNQLLIFKKRSIYRLIGDKPSNFTIEEIDSRAERTSNTAIVKCGDALYFMTAGGICCFNGVTAGPMPDARRVKRLIEGADVSASSGALCRDRLYFTMEDAAGTALIEYDLVRGLYMLRRGFTLSGMCASDGALYIIDQNRRICRFNEGSSYDGAHIDAYWKTPETDLRDKSSIKGMRGLYLRGECGPNEEATLVDVTTGGVTSTHRLLLPQNGSEVLETPLCNEGRTFSLRFYNEAGGSFALKSGAEIEFDERRRTI